MKHPMLTPAETAAAETAAEELARDYAPVPAHIAIERACGILGIAWDPQHPRVRSVLRVMNGRLKA